MGKKHLTVRKRRKNERNILATKKQNIKSVIQGEQMHCSPTLRKYGNNSKQQNIVYILSGLSCGSGKDDRNSILSDPFDSDSIERGIDNLSDHSEQCNDNISSELPDCPSICSEPAIYEAQQNLLSSAINLDPDCCRHSLVDMEPTNWKFSFHTSELPDINSVGMDTELMTINPVSDPFHYMSIPVLSAFGLVFENALQELRYSYMNLIQTINSTGRWFLLPSDNNTIQLCTYDINSASAPVITLTIEIHHSHRWFLCHTTGVMLQNQHPVLATLPEYLHSGHDIKMVTDTIDKCHQCKGIDDPRFFPLVVKNKGQFYDFQGN